VPGGFNRLKVADATVVQEPYQPGEAPEGGAWHRHRKLEGGRQMDERTAKASDLLHEAAETHHQVFRITDGADDDWASWYAQWTCSGCGRRAASLAASSRIANAAVGRVDLSRRE
jgi:hypothetical protein